jgi:hypothetical protein
MWWWLAAFVLLLVSGAVALIYSAFTALPEDDQVFPFDE